ncbi:HAD superfamily hydrolase (TIGR01509 family) [Kribbella rubisoli]|uniref:HAD superfamily hydrolase (TIGR01509 family) n=1 Tax=Kribbella rubisoli TaxID=3075929 RepID=A0A4Q7XLF7_9ACTN|nr:HAD-IA family hydrolase [Kribbella rubisoli]RZU24341.1 HAD superfamily hydrolase (TIGR01509 family) [Kribbella rubisoli]
MWSPNARDIGGLPTRYGVPTRARALLRSECIDATGLPAFEEVGAGLVLDLRSDWELKQPHPLAGDLVYQRIPWIDPAAEATRDPAAEPGLVDVYRNSLTRNAAHVGRIFTAIAEAPADQPVVVHCKSGKDRTGLTVALLLDLVGVPRSDIAADYAISETNLGLQDAPALSRSHPDTILGSLSYVDERYGGVRRYLAWLGLSETQIHRLAARLVPTDVQAIVFDFDGLLMDTETTMVESWQTEWAYHGLELDLDGFWPGHGGDVSEDRYAVLAAAVGSGFDRAESQARRLAHRDRMHADLDFRPGIRDWISSARELGLQVAIASSSPRSWVVGHLERVDAVKLFDEIITGDEVAKHKPDPAIYQLALERIGVPGSAAIAVEDTAHGVAAAQAADMFAVAVPNPFVTPAAVAAANLALSSANDLSLSDLLLSAGSRTDGRAAGTVSDRSL